jgi:hypothetical protein
MAITTRTVKGSALTHAELDTNFTDLVAVDAATDVAVAAVAARATALEVVKYNFGIEDHNSTDAALTPSNGVRTKVLNNGLGGFTNTAYKIPGRANLWDATAHAFDFSGAGLVLGDTVTIRLDFTVTTSGANDAVDVELQMGVLSGIYSLNLASQAWRSSGTYNLTVVSEIYMGDTNTLDNLGEIYITPDANGTSITYNGHYVKYGLRNASAT